MTHRLHASPVRPDTTLPPRLEGYFGGTGTGKSTSLKRRLRALDRTNPIVIFDPKHEYLPEGMGREGTEEKFLTAVTHMGNTHKPVRWAILQPPFEHEQRSRAFNRFCRCALSVAQHRGGCIVVVDELHLVTDSARGRVPAGWLELVNTGRAYGVHVLAASIRPQSIDMDFRSNLSFIRSGRLGERADCERVASKLMVPWEDVAALPNLAYIERDMLAGTAAVRGVLTF